MRSTNAVTPARRSENSALPPNPHRLQHSPTHEVMIDGHNQRQDDQPQSDTSWDGWNDVLGLLRGCKALLINKFGLWKKNCLVSMAISPGLLRLMG